MAEDENAPFADTLLETRPGKTLSELPEDQLKRWEAELSEKISNLASKRYVYEQMDPKQGVPAQGDFHWGARCGEAVHALTRDIALLTSARVTIMGRLADIGFREGMRGQNRRLEIYTIVVGLMVLTQLLLTCGVIGGKSDGQAEVDSTSKPQLESPVTDAPSETP